MDLAEVYLLFRGTGAVATERSLTGLSVHHQRFATRQRQDLRRLRLREVPPGQDQG